MNKGKALWIPILGIIVMMFCFVDPVSAIYYHGTKFGDIEVTGKIYTQASWRTKDGWARNGWAPKWKRGDLAQHRNYFALEVKDTFNENFEVFGSMRVSYDGVREYGADQWRDQRNNAPDVEVRLWEGYANISFGDLWLRLGRQKVSWGDTAGFRLLDGICPLDNTWGFFTEDLDERLLPLDMARGAVTLGNLGPIFDITLEGFLASGKPIGPFPNRASMVDNPYALPLGGAYVIIDDPKRSDFRGGARLLAMTGPVSWSVAHFWSYPDSPYLITRLGGLAYGSPITGVYKRTSTTGASGSWFTGLRATQTVLLVEMAYMWKDYMGDLSGLATGMDTNANPITRFKWAINLDNAIWIRALNKTKTFSFGFTLFASHIMDDNDGNYTDDQEDDYLYFLNISTSYYHGFIGPSLTLMYNPEGAWMFQPGIKYSPFSNFELTLKWAEITGNGDSISALRDWSNLAVRATYYFK